MSDSRGQRGADAAAFDGAAAGYDAEFSDRLLGRLLRGLLQQELERHLPATGMVLELGCGTGVDATAMARRGAAVLATDVSAAMRAQTAARAETAGLGLATAHLDLAAPQDATELALVGAAGPRLQDLARHAATEGLGAALAQRLDGAWSSFGPVNCVADCRALGQALERWLRPGARVALVVMPRLAPWDWLWYGAHLRPGAAVRRLRRRPVAQVPGGGSLALRYPGPKALDAELGPAFRRVDHRALGALLPISEAAGLVERSPLLFEALAAIERELADRSPLPYFCDHALHVWERRP